ncbi:MAG: hypothetical protein M0Q98_08480 [Pseudomonas sp.]|nr:hypothetical protein [Pseudomonas sp.]
MPLVSYMDDLQQTTYGTLILTLFESNTLTDLRWTLLDREELKFYEMKI